MMIQSRLLILFFAMAWGAINAQTPSLSNIRSKIISIDSSIYHLDSLTIIPHSVRIHRIPDKNWVSRDHYEILDNQLHWISPISELPDSVHVFYRVFPYRFDAPIQRILTDSVRRGADNELIGFVYNPYADNNSLIDFQGLNYNGSFARGISFGNNQDLVLNSSFNLQMAGKLGNDVEILAAITDENIPLQPEGNTQQLQEFDKIFIQLKKNQTKLIAGDYEITRPKSYFMNYYKKLEGATFSHSLPMGLDKKIDFSSSVAVSRGKFARNQIAQLEGNQGPYRLQGNENEQFIIVLSGTEKIWIDGNLLSRGIEADYVIDYNRGEITFTNKVLITKDSRIIVEFEYSDLNFNRTLYTIGSQYNSKKLDINFNFYSEQDGTSSVGNQALTDAQKQLLGDAGDNFLSSFASSIDSIDAFTSFQVAYALVDSTTSCGQFDSILVFSNDPETAAFSARFTFVGQGNGSYILDDEIQANDRVYKWVEPDPLTCAPRGDYAPVFQLIAPKQKRLMALGIDFRPNKTTRLSSEISYSINDLNRFSNLDSGDDQGMAMYTNASKTFNLSQKNENWQLVTDVQFEYTDQNFVALNPYRNPEFLRDWNLVNIQGVGNVERASEQIFKGGIMVRNKDISTLSYQLSSFVRGNIYNGLKHAALFELNQSGWDIALSQNWLSTDEIDKTTQFSRPTLKISKKFDALGGWRVGGNAEQERSARFANSGDTLNPLSFFYEKYRVFVESPSEKPFFFQLNYGNRKDFQPIESDFQLSANATELNLNGSWKQKRWLQLKSNLTYRNLEVNELDPNFNQLGSTFLGRTDLTLNLAKGAIRFTNTYEIGSGQEPKAEFSYIRVAQGEGTYIWLDSLNNNDGIIQPNEMAIAPFPDKADFIRITTFTNEFIQTDNVNLNQNLQLNPKAVWFNKKGIRKFLSRLSTQNTLKINRKTQEGADINAWNPFDLTIADTSLIAVSSSIRNILFFNRGNRKFDIQIGNADNRNKFVQTTGFESRQTTSYFLKTRINLSNILSAQINTSFDQRLNDSEFFNNNDYLINSIEFNPNLNYLVSKNLRFTLKYAYQTDRNDLASGGGEHADQHDFKLETTFNKSSKSAIRSQISWVEVDFSGATNSPVGFAILNGLQNGRNLLWNLTFDRQIATNIRLNISYDGRKTGDNQTVHVGRVQVAALF